MESYKNETLGLLRFMANYMKGFNYKDNTYKDNLLLIETGLAAYSVDKLKEYKVDENEFNHGKIGLCHVLTLLEKVVPEKDQDEFFFQYLNSTNMILTAMQNEDINLAIVDGSRVNIYRGDNNEILGIRVGKEIEPKNRILTLLTMLKNKEKGISNQLR